MSEIHLDPPPNKRQLMQRIEDLEAEIASLRTQVETLNGWKEGALLGSAEMRKEVAFWRERAEAAERELAEARREAHQELWRVTDIHRARFRRYRRMVAYKVKAAEAKLDKLVEWRRARSDTWHAPEGWRVVHEMRVRYAGPITYEHPKGAACTAIYPDGTTECAWLEAHKGELETEATSGKASG